MGAATKLFDAAPSSLVRHTDQSHYRNTWGGTEIYFVVTIWFSVYQLTKAVSLFVHNSALNVKTWFEFTLLSQS